MREIGTLENARDARRLSDYLLTLGIRTRVEEKPDAAVLWVYEEDQREQASSELAQFRANPVDPKYEAARAARALVREVAQREKQFRKNYVDVRQRWDMGSAGRRPLTMLLIALSVVVAVVTSFGAQGSADPWVQWLQISPVRVEGDFVVWQKGLSAFEDGQVWRLVTPIFIHFGWPHLLFNMFALLDIGSQVEMRRGTWRMLAMVLLLAVTSNLAQFYYSGPTFGGMSGVVFGLFGYVWMKSRYDPLAGFFLHPNTVFVAGLWFFLCFTPVLGDVANAAHTAGLVLGMLLGAGPTLAARYLNRLRQARP